MKRYFNLFLVFCLLLPLSACTCEHEWKDATCEESKICTKCEKSEGEPLGHDWNEATCEQPKTCKRCGAIEGKALGHDWVEASCDSPKYCLNCGKQQGKSMGHDVKEWSYLEVPTSEKDGKREGVCIRCNKKVNESISKEQYAIENKFIATGSTSLMDFLDAANDNGYDIVTPLRTDNTVVASLNDKNKDTIIKPFIEYFTEKNKVYCVSVIVDNRELLNTDEYKNAFVAIAQSINPNLSKESSLQGYSQSLNENGAVVIDNTQFLFDTLDNKNIGETYYMIAISY